MIFILLLTILFSTLQLSSTEPVTVTIPSQTINIHTHSGSTSGAFLDNKTNVQQQSNLLLSSKTIHNIFNQARDHAQEYTNGIFSWIHQNKKKTILYGAALSYGYIWYKLLSLNYALLQNTQWSLWHEADSLEQLLARPQQEVAADLLTSIQRMYTTPEQLDDLIGPLIAFVRDVDTEITQLKQLLHIHTWIDRLHISFLFPKQSTLLAQAQESIHRLTYLKNLLLNWVSEHKVARLTAIHAS